MTASQRDPGAPAGEDALRALVEALDAYGSAERNCGYGESEASKAHVAAARESLLTWGREALARAREEGEAQYVERHGSCPHKQARMRAEAACANAVQARDEARAERDRLAAALHECVQQVGEDGKPCWCQLPYMVPYRGHDAGCEGARAVLASAQPTPSAPNGHHNDGKDGE